jgi:predicted nucleotidyltransferase
MIAILKGEKGTLEILVMKIQISANTFERLSDACRRYHVAKLSLFGSHLHGEERSDSDLDILVEFDPGSVPGFDFVALQDELAEILGRTVDLRTAEDLSRYFRDSVVREAEELYVAG